MPWLSRSSKSEHRGLWKLQFPIKSDWDLIQATSDIWGQWAKRNILISWCARAIKSLVIKHVIFTNSWPHLTSRRSTWCLLPENQISSIPYCQDEQFLKRGLKTQELTVPEPLSRFRRDTANELKTFLSVINCLLSNFSVKTKPCLIETLQSSSFANRVGEPLASLFRALDTLLIRTDRAWSRQTAGQWLFCVEMNFRNAKTQKQERIKTDGQEEAAKRNVYNPFHYT